MDRLFMWLLRHAEKAGATGFSSLPTGGQRAAMTQIDRVPTRAVQDVAQGREGELLDGAYLVTTRRTNAQMAQLIEAAEASERELLLSVAAKLGAGR